VGELPWVDGRAVAWIAMRCGGVHFDGGDCLGVVGLLCDGVVQSPWGELRGVHCGGAGCSGIAVR
jgi:hypothetical protein